ncbi:hypothetical protein JL720_1778 [Aureococcus anophagefferens]|nr:hypothetical protein JL720_1778 [Aureococcus anophagefferens]
MAALRDEILLGSGFEEKLNGALPRWRRAATDEELPGLGFEKLVTTSGREFYVHENEAQFERPIVPVPASGRQRQRPTVPVPAIRRLATDEELSGLGYMRFATSSGREFYVCENKAQFYRPTISVRASRRPATDEELPGLGFEKLTLEREEDSSVADVEVYVPANEAQFKRSDNGLAGSLGEEPTSVHVGFICDGCGMNPIRGLRFRCTVRRNYDLCGRCDQRDTETYPKRKMPASMRLATDEELQGLGYVKEDLVDGREFYRDANEAQFERPLVTGDVVPLRCDRGAFLECYASSMMRFTKLTRHQCEKLGDVRAAPYALLLAPAGGGKTFVAIQRALEVLHTNQMVLFVSKNSALALFVVKWLVVASRTSARRVAARVRVLVAPFERGPLEIRVEEADGRQRLAIGGRVEEAERYGLAVVDEAHHLAGDVDAREAVRGVADRLFLGDASQATSAMDGTGLVRSIADVPESAEVATVALEEVVRSTKRIVAGAAAFQLEAGKKAATRGHSASVGPPLEARIFDGHRIQRYAREVDAAIESVRRQLHGMDLDDRVAVVCPNADFCERLRAALAKRLGRSFEIVDAATASATLPRGRNEREGSPAWLVVDTVDHVDGLERLVVVCAGLDHAISVDDATALETRSRLYRAMTRAQLAVAVVNHRVPGGWLEFLGRLELSQAMGFHEGLEKRDRSETAADDVVAFCEGKGGNGAREARDEAAEAVATQQEEVSNVAERLAVEDGGGEVAAVNSGDVAAVEPIEQESPASYADKGGDGVREVPDAAPGAALEREIPPRLLILEREEDSSVAERLAVGDGGGEVVAVETFEQESPAAAVPKVRQSIWDTSSCVSVDAAKLRFMPFLKIVDLSKLAELARLKAYGAWSVAVFPDGRRVVSGSDSDDGTVKVFAVAVFPDGRRVVSGADDNTVKVTSVAVFPDGRRVVSGSNDVTVKVHCVAVFPDGRHVVSGAGDAMVKVNSVAVFFNGRRVVSGSDDGTVKVWSVAVFPDGRRVVSASKDEAVKVSSVAVFPDGRRVVSGSSDKTVKVWDAATGECVATLAGHSGEVKSVAVFPDGRRVVSGSKDETVKVKSVAVFPDGRRVVSGSYDETVKVKSVAVFPDGRRVVSGADDETVKVWDAATGECVDGVAVFPDGRRVVSGSFDNTVKRRLQVARALARGASARPGPAREAPLAAANRRRGYDRWRPASAADERAFLARAHGLDLPEGAGAATHATLRGARGPAPAALAGATAAVAGAAAALGPGVLADELAPRLREIPGVADVAVAPLPPPPPPPVGAALALPSLVSAAAPRRRRTRRGRAAAAPAGGEPAADDAVDKRAAKEAKRARKRAIREEKEKRALKKAARAQKKAVAAGP